MGIILAVFTIIVAVGFVIVRLTIFAVDKSGQMLTINRIKKNPTRATLFAEQLDIPCYKKEDINANAFRAISKKISESSHIGSYQIHFTHPLGADRLLVFTELAYKDFDVNISGKLADTNKKAVHNFVLQHHPDVNELQVLSNLHANNTEKFQKQEFFKSLMATSVN